MHGKLLLPAFYLNASGMQSLNALRKKLCQSPAEQLTGMVAPAIVDKILQKRITPCS